MPRNNYHDLRASETAEDFDEDLDIDLQELDPLQAPYNPRQGRRGQIASRDLRFGGRNSRRERYGRWNGQQHDDNDDENDDSQGLLGGRSGGRKSSIDLEEQPARRRRPGQGHFASLAARFRRFSSIQAALQPDLESDDSDSGEGENDPLSTRTILVGQRQAKKYPRNAVSNAKYTPWTFLPITLYNEFSFFFNLYFLLVALSQIIPKLRIGYLSTYIAPLAFVLAITLGKEAIDDVARRRRDAEANSEPFRVISFDDSEGGTKKVGRSKPLSPNLLSQSTPSELSERSKRSRDLKVGDVLVLEKDQRVPADVVILKAIASEGDGGSGEVFIRTDQLDGETDWKLRLAVPLCQNFDIARFLEFRISAGKPDRKINDFVGAIELLSNSAASVPLTIDNTAWANTVLASTSTVLAAVVYTGRETRQALSTSPSRSKTGLLEYEINALTKILCALTLSISIILVGLEGFESTPERKWYIAILRFLILFSTIIPISLRVNLDMGKSVYAWFIERDQDIRGAVVRTSTIPEELGRIEYLLSDKTGTLTQNEMELKKIHVGTVAYANDAMDEVSSYIKQGFSSDGLVTPASMVTAKGATRTRREIGARVRDVVLALALCHSVTPTSEDINGVTVTEYQASSPDEIAIVRWTEAVGLRLLHRDRQSMTLQSSENDKVVVKVRILELFPFTSEGKRMGIVVQFLSDDDIDQPSETWFYQKGADTVMSSIVAANDWLDEETANMAREGLRTLVIGRKKLSAQQYQQFKQEYQESSLSLSDRDGRMKRVVAEHLEQNLELLGITGVEDKLQDAVKPSLELLRNAGIKIWMLTGDKVETARCVAISSKLVVRGQYIHTITQLKRKDSARDALDLLRSRSDACLLIDGESLALFLRLYRNDFISIAVHLPTVVACRCSPTQKADVAKLIRAFTKKRVCCIGDGGNDVSMIQAADVGIGIVGKEGRQASLAADFSIHQFSHLTKLLVWHGRNSYKRSAKLAQFVIHRGLIISVCQTMYSIASKFEPNALYKDWLLVGYATVYTMFPVFSLVLDKDVDEGLANLYPELYKELTTGRSLSYRTFFVWVLVSIYQGGIIQGMSQLLVSVDGPRMVAVSFTVLVANELVMVAFEITTWHPIMIMTLIGTAGLYLASIPFLGRYFDLDFVWTLSFLWRTAVISVTALLPVWAFQLFRRLVWQESWRRIRS